MSIPIITDYWPKPIPTARYDWMASRDGWEPGAGPLGFGATEQEAIDDLLRQEDDQCG